MASSANQVLLFHAKIMAKNQASLIKNFLFLADADDDARRTPALLVTCFPALQTAVMEICLSLMQTSLSGLIRIDPRLLVKWRTLVISKTNARRRTAQETVQIYRFLRIFCDF